MKTRLFNFVFFLCLFHLSKATVEQGPVKTTVAMFRNNQHLTGESNEQPGYKLK